MTHNSHPVRLRTGILPFSLFLFLAPHVYGAPATPPSSGDLPNVVSVRSFGAIGDGVHDDLPNIQRAINYLGRSGHGKITFDSFATYRVSRTLKLTSVNGIELDGQQATLKPLDNAEAADEQGGILYATNVKDLIIRGLRFDGNRTKRGPSPLPCRAQAISLGSCSAVEIAGCQFHDLTADGILLWATEPRKLESACRRVRIHENIIDSPWRNGISVVHGRMIDIYDNSISHAAGSPPESGIDVEPNGSPGEAVGITGDVKLSRNRFADCAIGVAVVQRSAVSLVTVTNNDMDHCGKGLDNSMAGLVWGGNYVHDTRPAGTPVFCHGGGTLAEP